MSSSTEENPNDDNFCRENDACLDDLVISNLNLGSGEPQRPTKRLSETKGKVVTFSLDKDELRKEDSKITKKLAVINVTLNMSKQNLATFPEDWFESENFESLEKIVLEGNQLHELPESFFKYLPNLKWLDLRNNKLSCLPCEGLENHGSLEVILLENNKIKTLPLEFGTINTLRAINLRNNPLEFPTEDIIEGGIESIKRYLREAFNETSDGFEGNRNNTNNNDLPLVENSTRLSCTSASSSLKKKLFSLHPKLCRKKEKPNSAKMICRTQSEKYVTETHGKPVSESMLEEKFKNDIKLSKVKQRLQKQDSEIEARKMIENVQNWKDKYKQMQAVKIQEKASNGGKLDFDEPASMAPFGVSKENFRMISDGERIYNKMNREKKFKPASMSMSSKIRLERAKLNHENFLKNKVAEHLASVKGRSYSGKEPRQIMLTAQRDLEIALKLQEEINKRQRELEFGASSLPAELFRE